MSPERISIARVDPMTAVHRRAQNENLKKKESGGVSERASATVDRQHTLERTRYRSNTSEEGSLTLTTAEGDKVTISFQNQQNTRYDQTALNGLDGGYQNLQLKTRESSSLSVKLDGSLSEAELEDITELVARISSGLQQPDSNTALISPKEDLSSIDSFSFAYQQSSSVSYQYSSLTLTV